MRASWRAWMREDRGPSRQRRGGHVWAWYLVKRVRGLLKLHASLRVPVCVPLARPVCPRRGAGARAALAVAEKNVGDVVSVRGVGIVRQILGRVVFQRPVPLPAVDLGREGRGVR